MAGRYPSAVSPSVLSSQSVPAALATGRLRCGVFGVGPHLVGLPVDQIEEMFVVSEVRRPPLLARHQRGVTRLRDAVLPAFDLRVALGLASAGTELQELLDELGRREQDHRNWLAELEASTREKRPFTLATDPRKCNFGKWYYAFRTEDAVLRSSLANFEQPHNEIHSLAGVVEGLKQAGRTDDALAVVEKARAGLLATLVGVFAHTRKTMVSQFKEIGVTVQLGGRRSALLVDRAEAVTELDLLPPGSDPLSDGVLDRGLVVRLARLKAVQTPVLILDLARLAALT